MSPVLADVLLVTALIGALALVHRPFGDCMAAVYSSRKHLRVLGFLDQPRVNVLELNNALKELAAKG